MTVAFQPICCAETGMNAALIFAKYNADTNLPMIGMQFIIAAWIFVLGACFGSFLNVVIYRLPAGMSLGKPKSRCPRCETPLAARDNIPVFGWIFLKGKCRYCQLPIAARYPIIESVCGGIFLALLFGELLTGATNLPLRHPDHFHVNPGFWLVWFAKWDLLGIYLYHCCLLIVVLAVAMIGFDQHPPQKRLTVFALIVGLVCGTMWPELRPVPGWFMYSKTFQSIGAGFEWTDTILNPGGRYWTGVTLVGFLDGILGLLGGAVFGRIVTWPLSQPKQTSSLTWPHIAAIHNSFLVTGAFLGWQACGMLAVITLPTLAVIVFAIRQGITRFEERAIAPAFFAMLLTFLLVWSRLALASWMIGIDGWKFSSLSWQIDCIMTTAAMMLAALVFGRFVGQLCPIAEAQDETGEFGISSPTSSTDVQEQSES